MLIFNLRRVLALRGIDKPFAFLLKKGFHRTIAANLANNSAVQIKISHIERLCRALNCTPNDMFEWQADENAVVSENYALKSLVREKSNTTISDIVHDISIEKLERAKEILAELKESEK